MLDLWLKACKIDYIHFFLKVNLARPYEHVNSIRLAESIPTHWTVRLQCISVDL